jgi:hypothetical protein
LKLYSLLIPHCAGPCEVLSAAEHHAGWSPPLTLPTWGAARCEGRVGFHSGTPCASPGVIVSRRPSHRSGRSLVCWAASFWGKPPVLQVPVKSTRAIGKSPRWSPAPADPKGQSVDKFLKLNRLLIPRLVGRSLPGRGPVISSGKEDWHRACRVAGGCGLRRRRGERSHQMW